MMTTGRLALPVDREPRAAGGGASGMAVAVSSSRASWVPMTIASRAGRTRRRPPNRNLDRDRQGLQAPQDDRFTPPDLILRQAHAGKAAHQPVERDLPLQARQRSAEAEMDPGAKRQVGIRLAAKVEILRIGELLRVAVAGAEQQHHGLALTDRASIDLEVLERHPAGELDRRIETEQLLDRGARQALVLLPPLTLLRVPEQGQQPIANQVDRRLVPGDQKQVAHRQYLFVAEAVALLLGVDEAADQVRATLFAPLPEDVAEVTAQPEPGLECGGFLLRSANGVQVHGNFLRPLPEDVTVRPGNAQHFRDHGAANGIGVVRDDLHGAAPTDVLEQLVDERLYARPEVFDHTRRERLVHQAAQAGVGRWVGIEHRARDRELVTAYLGLGAEPPGMAELVPQPH